GFWLRKHDATTARFDGGGYRVEAQWRNEQPWLRFARPHCQPTQPPAWFDPAPTHAALAGGDDGYRVLAWPDGTDLRQLQPPLQRIRELDGRALIITAGEADGVGLRYFAPQYGNDEDAATGSA